MKKAVEHESDGDYNWCTWSGYQRPGKETIGTGDQSKNQNHPDPTSIKIGLNT